LNLWYNIYVKGKREKLEISCAYKLGNKLEISCKLELPFLPELEKIGSTDFWLPASCDFRLTSWKAGTFRKLELRRSLAQRRQQAGRVKHLTFTKILV